MRKGFVTLLLISVFSLTCIFTNVLPSYATEPCRCNGNHGYVAKKYIESMDGSKIYAKVKLDDEDDWSYLNVREKPSLDAKVVKTLHHGDIVKAGESEGSKDGIDWILIHY